jgi:N-acetylglutamate synthase-like GNAT family acetyltransferase
VHLRRAEMADAPAIMKVINAAFKKAESFFVDRDRVDEQAVRSFMQKGEFLLSEDGATVTGCVYVERRGDRGYIGLLSVDPPRQHDGLGSQLMVAAEERCRGWGCRVADLQVVSLRRELPDFYRRRGYTATGTAPFPLEVATKIPCHFIEMSKPLTSA